MYFSLTKLDLVSKRQKLELLTGPKSKVSQATQQYQSLRQQCALGDLVSEGC